MNVLFLSLYHIDDINNRGIYEDVLREFIKNQHEVYVVTPVERRVGKSTEMSAGDYYHLLSVKTGNIQKTNIIEKGISTVLLETQFITAIKKYLSDVKFDLVIYSTPPITLAGVVDFIKKRDHARTYLLLKDIFPQNAVDIGMMSKTGITGILYRCFRNKEKKLYALSDRIGCMSQANVSYLLKHNPEISADKVEVCPNSIEPVEISLSEEERVMMRNKYGIPTDKKVFVNSGNFGKPQGIPFLIECIRSQKDNDDIYFLMVGDGTEYTKLEAFVKEEGQANVKLIPSLPKGDCDRIIAACDVGMIFLDHRFTIPNFPSRLLSYMQASMPVLAVTDSNTDIGKVIVDGGFGWWCESKQVSDFSRTIDVILKTSFESMKEKSRQVLLEQYTTSNAYQIITELHED